MNRDRALGTSTRPERVAVLSYPMLFQAQGGLQVQVTETIAALQRLGCRAKMVDPNVERLGDFSLVHVFAINNGNHRLVESARAQGRPVVVSPLLRPIWTSRFARRAAMLDRVFGRMISWELSTEYRQFGAAVRQADRCVALGQRERQGLHEAFNLPLDRIDVVPNGIGASFFGADPQPFLQTFGLASGFVLCVASINPHKNQLGLARALDGLNVPLVLVGECQEPDRAYLRQVLAHRNVRHVGSLPHDSVLLASAYAAAGVLCLASMSEVMPLCVLESLAAGRPVVMTRHHSMDLSGLRNVIRLIEPTSEQDIREVTRTVLANPVPAESCRRAVAGMTWDAVAAQLLDTYALALQDHAPTRDADSTDVAPERAASR